VCIVIQILRALATAQSFERRLVSDVAFVPILDFVSTEAGTESLSETAHASDGTPAERGLLLCHDLAQKDISLTSSLPANESR